MQNRQNGEKCIVYQKKKKTNCASTEMSAKQQRKALKKFYRDLQTLDKVIQLCEDKKTIIKKRISGISTLIDRLPVLQNIVILLFLINHTFFVVLSNFILIYQSVLPTFFSIITLFWRDSVLFSFSSLCVLFVILFFVTPIVPI